MFEIIGYVGSILVAVSLMMSNIWRLRWINLVGAVFFVVYGLAVKAYPVAAVNAFIVAIDAYYLGMLAGRKDYFNLMTVPRVDESLLSGFLDCYREDIMKYFPDFTLYGLEDPKCVFILRNLNPVGLFVYEKCSDESVRIHLDYVIPEYRDLKNARYLYSNQAGKLREQGFKEFRVRAGSKEFESYARKLGFQPAGDKGSYTKAI